MALTKAELDDIISKLADIPPPSDEERIVSRQEMISRLRPVIRKLRSKGYSPAQIHQILDQTGIEISRRQVELSVKKKQGLSSKSTPRSKSVTDTANRQPKGGLTTSPKDNQTSETTSSKPESIKHVDEQGRNTAHFTPDPDVEEL